MRRTAAAVLAVFLTSGCGYVMSGTWEDDPENWARAFESTKPPEVIVLHSKYSRSPHWSYEFQYFFEIAPNAGLEDQLITANKLRPLTVEEAAEERASLFSDPPPWFAPKSSASYEVWVFADEPGRNFRALIDKASGHMFVTDGQL